MAINKGQLNLNLLNALALLLEEQNVSRAARRMHVTQSAMSKYLAKLRTLFDDPLLIRLNNELTPTPKARELKVQVTELLHGMENLLTPQSFDPALCQRRYTLAATDYVCEYILPETLGAIYRQAPRIHIDLTLWDQDTPRQLKTGEVDMGTTLAPKDTPDLHATLVGSDRMVALVHHHHRFSQQTNVDTFCQHKHIEITSGADKTAPLDHYLRSMQLSREVLMRTPSYPSAIEVLLKTDFILTLPGQIARQLIEDRPLTLVELPFELPTIDYALIWHHHSHHDPAQQWLRNQFKEGLIHYNRKFALPHPCQSD